MFPQLTPVTKSIIIINAIFFVGVILLQNLNINIEALLAGYFPLSPNFRSWQIVTHMFMHGSFMHILFNMFTLYSFGPVLEQVLGQKKFIILYFAAGLGGFLLFNLWNYYELSQITNYLTTQGFDIHEVYKTVDTRQIRYYPQFSDNEAIDSFARQLFDILNTNGWRFRCHFRDCCRIFNIVPGR